MPDHSWSDERLEQFYGEFKEHKRLEALEQKQNQEIYDAVFQRADPYTNTPPGLLQATAQISKQLHDIAVRQDRQKIAVRTAVATCSAVWFLLTDAGHKFFALLQKL
jgi:hypothetical protein